jgi:RNA polymerase sigma factor (TIGR02999 family)
MDDHPPGKVTSLLREAAECRDGAQDALFRLVHAEIRRIAAGKAGARTPLYSATELVNEAYARLFNNEAPPGFKDRRHFYCTVAKVMRNIVVDEARRKKALIHGGGVTHVPLDEGVAGRSRDPELALRIEEGLEKLRGARPEAALVFELEHFAGQTHDHAAEALGLSNAAVRRLWTFALGFLGRELNQAVEG